MIAYILSLLLSIPALVMVIALALAEYNPDSVLYKYYGVKETLVILSVSFIFIIIGWIYDTNIRKDEENG